MQTFNKKNLKNIDFGTCPLILYHDSERDFFISTKQDAETKRHVRHKNINFVLEFMCYLQELSVHTSTDSIVLSDHTVQSINLNVNGVERRLKGGETILLPGHNIDIR